MIHNLIPQTQAWHDFRRQHIGASDAPIIMGVSPWKNIQNLWKEKCGEENTFKNFAMQRGIDLEPKALVEYCEMTNYKMTSVVMTSEENPLMSASLDGWDGIHAVEIKCAGKHDHKLALGGQIPEKYYPQLQHQIFVAGLQFIEYFSYDGNQGVIIMVYRNEKYISLMLSEHEKFWKSVQEFTIPENISSPKKIP